MQYYAFVMSISGLARQKGGHSRPQDEPMTFGLESANPSLSHRQEFKYSILQTFTKHAKFLDPM
jgi:hypothetical protein